MTQPSDLQAGTRMETLPRIFIILPTALLLFALKELLQFVLILDFALSYIVRLC